MTAASKTAMDKLHIGGEMELDASVLLRSHPEEPPPVFPGAAMVSNGRVALRITARLVKEQSGRRPLVLLPSYLCPSIAQPFYAEKLDVCFYPIDESLTTDPKLLLGLIRDVRPGACLFINYFGFPPNGGVAEALSLARELTWVIEDCSQGFWTDGPDSPVGRIGDFVLSSLRKFLPVPDGAVLINRTGVPLPELEPAEDAFVRYRLLGKLLRHEFLQRPEELADVERTYLSLFAEAEGLLHNEIGWYGMSAISRRCLADIDFPEVLARRRRNFSYIARAFREDEILRRIARPVFTDLLPGVMPLVFPIRIFGGRRDEVRRHVVANGIFSGIHWPLPEDLPAEEFAASWRLCRSIMSLPIDQRYVEEDMEELLRRLRHSA